MLAIKLFNKISNAIDHKITAASITKYPTIEGFVSYLDTNHKTEEENGELYEILKKKDCLQSFYRDS